MRKDTPWHKTASRLLKAQMKSRGITYGALNSRLHNIGISCSPVVLATKINGGGFSFYFFLQCAKAMNIHNISLDILYDDSINTDQD